MPLLAAALLAASSAAAGAHRHYEVHEATRLVPLLTEVLRFDTVAGHDRAHAAQKQWLRRVGEELGFVVREAGPVTEVECERLGEGVVAEAAAKLPSSSSAMFNCLGRCED